MITIKINGQAFGFDKDVVESAVANAGIEKISQSDFGGKKGMFNSLIGSAFMMMGVKKPKEADSMDNLEFASRLALHSLLANLEGQTIELHAKDVGSDAEKEANSIRV